MATSEPPADEVDGGERGKQMRRSWFSDQSRQTQDDVIKRGFKDKFGDAEQAKELKPYKPRP